ncbi:MAG: 2Fe-2S iron-sulfur cluster-binding protein [bacterium]|nr:2Fe-2S iron-sulfur cluster-binding protein [bacterium]
MAQITLNDGQQFTAAADRRLVLALMDHGIDILHRCGGNARCTTCRVHFIHGEPQTMTQAEFERLEARGLLGEARLSCQLLCEQDMKIEVINRLSESDLDDAGPDPEPYITPNPVWITKPAAR